ncbi:MAG: hypothetical protein ACREJO_06965 [Phycisphaerales bacterium]
MDDHSRPDFIIVPRNGLHVLCEAKGEADAKDRAKHEAARKRCRAVNNAGFGQIWDFQLIDDPFGVPAALSQWAAQPVHQVAASAGR